MASEGIVGISTIEARRSDLFERVSRELSDAVSARIKEIGPIVLEAGMHLHQGMPSCQVEHRPFPEDRTILRVNVPMRLCGEKHEETTDATDTTGEA